jgi:hypothetical protein
MNTQIHSYEVEVATGPETTRSVILLRNANGANIGRLQFHDEGDEVPKDGVHRDGKTPLLHLPYPAYGAVIDLLRNESPVFITRGALSTNAEPVGEDED